MKHFIALIFTALFFTTAQAQILTQINNQFLTNGIVDAAKQDLYTYKNISTNTFPPAANFEIKKLNQSTNQFDVVHSFVNPQTFVNHYVLSVINKKFLLHGDFKGTTSFNFGGSNLYVFDGVNTYDSLFTLSDSISYINNPFYTDVATETIYFLVYGKAGVSGVYKSDFTKAGTTNIKPTPATGYNAFVMEGLGNKLYMNIKSTNAALQTKNYLIKYDNGVETMIDSTAELFVHMYKDEINSELYVVSTNFLNRVVRKIDANGTVTVLTTITTPIGNMIGKINNNLLFTASNNSGVQVLNLATNAITTLYATGTTNQPDGFTSTFDVAQTPSKKYIYLKSTDPNSSLNKIWVTDGVSIIKADSSVYTVNNAFLDVENNFCGDNMISMDYVAYNSIGLVTTTPTGTTSKQCVVSSVPTWNCVTTGQFTTSNNLYVVASDNLYKAVCGASSVGMQTVKSNNNFKVYPNPANNSITIEGGTAGNSFQIINTLGQQIKEIKTSTNANIITINIANWSQGVYVIKSSDGATSSFVKQ